MQLTSKHTSSSEQWLPWPPDRPSDRRATKWKLGDRASRKDKDRGGFLSSVENAKSFHGVEKGRCELTSGRSRVGRLSSETLLWRHRHPRLFLMFLFPHHVDRDNPCCILACACVWRFFSCRLFACGRTSEETGHETLEPNTSMNTKPRRNYGRVSQVVVLGVLGVVDSQSRARCALSVKR